MKEWSWPVTTTSTASSSRLTIRSTSARSAPPGVDAGRAGVGGLLAPLVEQHHEGPDAARTLRISIQRLAASASSRKVRPATPAGVTTVGASRSVRPMKATLTPLIRFTT